MATTTETWAIETGNARILRYNNGGTITYSADNATCYYAKEVDGQVTTSPEDGTLEYSYDKTTWNTYTQPIPSATVWDNGGTVYFRVKVDGKSVLSLATVVQDYSADTQMDVPAYVNGRSDVSVSAETAQKYDHIDFLLKRTVDGINYGVAAAETVTIHKTATGTQYALSVTPNSIVKNVSNRWQNFTNLIINVSKQVGDSSWTLAGTNEVGVYYRINDGLPSERVQLENGSAVIGSSVFSPTTTEKIDVFITASEPDDPVIDIKTIAVLQNTTGVSGHVGRFYYYDGVYSDTKDYLMDTTQAPYVKRHCTIDGVEGDYFFMLDFGGRDVSNPTSYGDDPADEVYRNGNPWTQMSSTFQYYIAEAFFGSYAHFGAFIINGDWMISQYGRIYYSNGQGTNIDSAAKAAQFKNDTGTDAYTNFYPQYPNSNYPGVMNFCPSFAVDGLTGRVYLNKAFFKGGMSVPMFIIDDTNLSEYTSDVSGNRYVEFIPDDVGGFNFQCSSALTLALPYPDETMDGREFEVFNSTDNASATINVLGTNVVGGGNNTIGKNGYMKYKVVKADIYDNWEWLRIAKMGNVT